MDYPELTFETNGMSTQVFGDYNLIMIFLNETAKPILESHKAMFVIKLAGGHLHSNELPEELRK